MVEAIKQLEYPVKDVREQRKTKLLWVANDGFIYSKEMNRKGRPKGAKG